MHTIIVLFNLKPNASVADYETWAKASDIPTVKSLSSIDEFKVLKMGNLLGTTNPSPYQYCEILEVNNMETFFAELNNEAVQSGAKQFAEFADNPLFITTTSL